MNLQDVLLCPTCKRGHSVKQSPNARRAGVLGVCPHCGEIFIVDESGQLRAAKAPEIAALPPALQNILKEASDYAKRNQSN
jgi:hypothetical protein